LAGELATDSSAQEKQHMVDASGLVLGNLGALVVGK
jgi:ribosomal protein L13